MTRIISPLARVKIGSDEFVSGDGILKAVSVDLGEDKRASKCQISLYDRGLLIGAKYQAISLVQGGIITPEGLLGEKKAEPSSAPASPSSDPSNVTTSGSSTQNASFSPQLRAFLDVLAFAEGADYNTLYGGKKFSSYSDHPGRVVAGRYQFQPRTWAGAKKALGLKDFSPASQDAAAIYLIREREAMIYVEQGSKGFRKALDLLSYEWASLPPQRYPNQSVKKLADLEVIYAKALQKYKNQNPAQSAAAIQPPANQPQQNKAADKPLQDKADQKPTEESQKGTEIIVELGFSLDQMVAFHFIHIGTNTSRSSLDETILEGAMIRWLLNRRTQNTAYTKITLRQLAQRICDRYGMKLDMEGNGPTYQYLDQTGISDYELLLREAKAIGYSLREDKNVLIIKPLRPNFTGFVITRDVVQTIRFSDRASADRSPTTGTTVSTPAVSAAEPKTKDDRKTGKTTQTKIEDTTGTGAKTGKPAAVTGTATPPLHGTTIPDTSVTGLPKQEIGSIDLADGSAEAQLIADESKRVKGYESQATLVTMPEILSLVPGSIIGVSNEVAPSPFNREFRVGSVRHTLSTAGMRTEIQMYSPQAQKQGSGTSGSTATAASGSTAAITEVKPGAFLLPCTGRTGNGVNAGGNGKRKHYGIDIANTQGTPIVASAEGVIHKALTGCRVGDQKCHGGYGNNIVVQHPNGYFTRYAHLHEVLVTPGQKVKQGEKIGTMGNTGHSTGSHLHFEIRKGGSFSSEVVVPSDVGLVIPRKHDVGFKY